MIDWGGRVAAWLGAVAVAGAGLAVLFAQASRGLVHDLFIALVVVSIAAFVGLVLTGPRAAWVAWRRRSRSTEGHGKPPISLGVEILGPISRVDRIDQVLESAYDREEEEFSRPRPAPTQVPGQALVGNIFGRPEPLSEEERAQRLARWKQDRPANVRKGRACFLEVVLPGSGVRVVSRDRFVAKPELVLAFHDCEVFDCRHADEADYEEVVEPVVRNRNPFGRGIDRSVHLFRPRDYPVSWCNRGKDAVVTLTPESFRPNVPWSSGQDDYVLLIRDEHATVVNVSWVLTEDGNDQPAVGALTASPTDLGDAASLFLAAFTAPG